MVNDFLNEIYSKIKVIDNISTIVEDRISFYEYRHYEDETKPFIVLRPLNASTPEIYGNDVSLREYQDIQIDIQSKDRKVNYLLMNDIEKRLRETMLFTSLTSDSLDTYLEQVGRFVLAKKFRCKSKL